MTPRMQSTLQTCRLLYNVFTIRLLDISIINCLILFYIIFRDILVQDLRQSTLTKL